MEKKEKLDTRVYNELVSNVRIKNINLANLHIKEVKQGLTDISLSANLDFQNEKFDLEENLLRVTPHFLIEVCGDKNGQQITAFTIEFEYMIDYFIENMSSFDVSYIELFVKRNVPVNIWPYARELISSLTTRIGYPALIIEPLKG